MTEVKNRQSIRRLVGTITIILGLVAILFALAGSASAQGPAPEPTVRIAYFYSDECPHCKRVIEEVLTPLREEYDGRIEIKMVEIYTDPTYYEMLLRAEEMFAIPPEKKGLPTLIVGGQALVGEDEIRDQLSCLIDSCLLKGGTTWPDIPGLDAIPVWGSGSPTTSAPLPGLEELEPCDTAEEAVCETTTVWAAYFYEVGCQKCSRAESDIWYVQSKYPQLVIDEFNIYDSVNLARWMARRAGREEELHTPALFIGDDVLIGAEEISPQRLEAIVSKYAATGTERFWEDFDAATDTATVVGPLQVIVGGLLDGLNPCAFATLIFFISYLTFSERRDWEILAVGIAFTVGVFLTYLAIGLGLYRLLDAVRDTHAALSHWAYLLTAVLCAVLAVFNFLDFLKARRGEITDMTLVMPEALRRRAHAVVRRSSRAQAFVVAAVVTGAAVSFLELACTGQVYLAILISMTSIPASRTQAVPLLILYNLMFVVPLIVVFVLVYLGTSSMQLGLFLRRHAATVKLGTALLFAALGTWLITSL